MISEEWLLEQVVAFAEACERDPRLTGDRFVEALPADLPASSREALLRRIAALRELDRSVAELDRQASLVPGMEMLGFRVLQRLGQGGMGQVFEALEVDLGRVVALKVVHWAASPT
ncbi:MAG TPA: hypothetical protein VK348_15540 [Planctomycetota bacterium]|nr:hypothetical protein [Planctomycetota bacterium]